MLSAAAACCLTASRSCESRSGYFSCTIFPSLIQKSERELVGIKRLLDQLADGFLDLDGVHVCVPDCVGKCVSISVTYILRPVVLPQPDLRLIDANRVRWYQRNQCQGERAVAQAASVQVHSAAATEGARSTMGLLEGIDAKLIPDAGA